MVSSAQPTTPALTPWEGERRQHPSRWSKAAGVVIRTPRMWCSASSAGFARAIDALGGGVRGGGYKSGGEAPLRGSMPELPDVTVYIEALDARVRGARLHAIRLANPFVLRS